MDLYSAQASTGTWQNPLSKETATEYLWLIVNQIVREQFPEDIIDKIHESGTTVSLWIGEGIGGETYPVEVNCHIKDRGVYDMILDMSREKDSFYVIGSEAFHVKTSAGTIIFFAPPGEEE